VHRIDVVCFRYIIVNTAHKGSNKDDDDDDDDDDDNNDNNNRHVDNTKCSLHPVLDTKVCNIMK